MTSEKPAGDNEQCATTSDTGEVLEHSSSATRSRGPVSRKKGGGLNMLPHGKLSFTLSSDAADDKYLLFYIIQNDKKKKI